MKKVCVFLIATLLAISGFSQIVVSTFPWSDGFESGLTNWTQVYVSGTNAWTQSTSEEGNETISPYAGTNMAVLSHNDRDDQTKLVSPVFDLSGITNPVLSFYYQNNSWGGDVNYLTVYYRTDTSSTGTWTQLSTYTSGMEAWTHVSLPLNSTSTTYQLAFEGYDNYGYPLCLDDVTISSVSCPAPTALVASNPTLTGLDLGWTDATGTNWAIEYMPSDSTNWETANSITTTSNPYTFTTLNSSSAYKFRVKSLCSATDESEWSNPITAVTGCDLVTTLPYTETFDNWGTGTGAYPICWSRIMSDNYPYISSSDYHSGVGSLYLYGLTPIAITPQLDITAHPLNTLRVKFYKYSYSTDYGVVVGAMTSPTDTASFTPIDTVYSTDTYIWEQFEIPFSDYTGAGSCFAFKVVGPDSYSSSYLDDIEISELPSCAKPTNLTFSNATSTGCDFGWTDATGSSWTIQYMPSDSTDWATADSVTTTSNPYTFNTLVSTHTYKFRVKAVCGADQESEWSNVSTFTVPCDAITEFPYTESFESGNLGCWAMATSNATYPWTVVTSGGNPTCSPVNGTHMLKYQSYNAPNYAWTTLTSAPMQFTDPMQVSFWIYKYPYSYPNERVSVFLNSNPDTIGATLLGTEYRDGSPEGWKKVTYYMPDALTGNQYVIFKGYSQCGYNIYIDSITVSVAPTCIPPFSLAAVDSNTTTTSIDLTWTNAHATDNSWIVYYKPAGATNWDSTIATQNPYTLSGLNPSTLYNIKMATDCGDAISETTDPISVATSCGAISALPFIENFDNWGTGESSYPLCWSRFMSSSQWTHAPYINNNNSHSGVGSLYLYTPNAIAITPQIDTILHPINTLRIKFYNYSYDASYKLVVGLMTNPADSTTFVSFDTITPIAYSWEQNEISFANATEGAYIAFRSIGYDYCSAFIDDIEISEIPSCVKVTSLAASGATLTSLNLSWTPGHATDSVWNVYYKATSDTSYDSVQVTTNPYTLAGLNPSTSYSLVVRTNCEGYLAETSDTISAYTLCGAIASLPYSESFESDGETSRAYPHCWTKLGSGANYLYNYTTNHYGIGTHSLYMKVNNSYSIAVLPQIDTAAIDMHNLSVSFVYAGLGGQYPLQLGTMTDPTDASTFTTLTTVTPARASYWEPQQILLNNYTINGTYLAFKIERPTNATTVYAACLDNVVLDTITPCREVYSLYASNKTESSVTIAWSTTNATGNGWNVKYWLQSDTTGSSIVTDTLAAGVNPPYTIAGLSSNTIYGFAVRQVCAGGGADWDTIFVQTEGAAPATLPYASNFADSTERIGWILSNSTSTDKWCWGTASTLNSGNYTLYISNNNGVANTYNTSTSGYEVVTATRKFVSTGAASYTLTFKEQVAGESSWDYLKVFVGDIPHTAVIGSSPSWANASYGGDGALLLGSYYYKSNSSSTITSHTFTIPAQGDSGAVRMLTFVWRQDGSGGTQPPVSIDSITLVANSGGSVVDTCTPPSFLVENPTTATAVVSWTGDTNQASWYIYYKPSTALAYDSVLVSASPYTLTGLTPSTVYNIYMRSVCSDTLSALSGVQTFYTECTIISSLPYTENFDAYGSGSFPTCWTRVTDNTSYPYTYSYQSQSAPYSMYFDTYNSLPVQMIVSPEINSAIAMDTVMVSFSMRSSYSGDDFKLTLGVMSNLNDLSTFDTIGSYTESSGEWTTYEIPLRNYTGTGHYIAFLCNGIDGSNYGYLDDVVIDSIPSCFHPSAPVISNITTTSAFVSWSGTSSSYIVSYTSGAGTTSIVTTEDTVTLTGLTNSTQYTVSVRGLCAVGDTSVSAPLRSFCTTQIPETIPYFCNFDAVGNNGWNLNNGSCTNKWYIGTPTGYTDGKLFVSNDGVANNYNTSSTSVVLAEKLFTFPADTTTLKFNLQVGGEGDGSSSYPYGYDFVKVFLVGSNDATIVPSTTTTTASGYSYSTNAIVTDSYGNYSICNEDNPTTVVTYSVVIPPLSTADTAMKLIFLWRNDGGGGTMPSATIDSISITTPNACHAPTALAVTASNTHATMTWTAGGEETSWEVKINSDTTVTEVYSPTYTFTGLTAGTTYTASVRANCGTSYSSWATIQFTTDTAQIAPTVTTNAAGAITQTTAVFSGVYEQGTDTVTTVGFEYKIDTAAGWTDLVSVTAAMAPTVFTSNVTTLTANRNYQLRAYAVTATEGKTYGNVKTFQTLANVLPTVTTDTVQGITTSSATFKGTTVQGTEAIIARGFEYKKSEGTSWIDISATGTATISATATGLTAGTSYVYRAYAETQSDGKTYGEQKTFLTTSSLADVESDDVNVTMYPNPTESTTKLTISGVSGKVQIVISDVAGRVIETIEAKAENGTVQKVLNVSPFAKGVYYIRVITDKLNRTQKLIVR